MVVPKILTTFATDKETNNINNLDRAATYKRHYIMNTPSLDFLESRGYSVERCINPEDERYRLMRGEDIILDDSACEDYYGTQDEVAEAFASYVRECVQPEEQKVEAALSAYDDGIGYTIIQSIPVSDDAKLMMFVSDNGIAKSTAVVYDDGTVFVTDDWQGYYAESLDEIEDYDWHTLNGQRAVIVDGLPRVL